MLSSVSLSPDGQTFATGGDDHVVRIWNLNDGVLVRELRGHSDWVRTVAYNPKGQIIASAGDDHHVLYWDAATGKLRQTLPGPAQVIYCLGFSADGKVLAAAGFDDKVRPLRRGNRYRDPRIGRPLF